MNLVLNLKFASSWGQQLFVCGNHTLLGSLDETKAVPLLYSTDQLWSVIIENFAIETDIVDYYYFLQNQDDTKNYSGIHYSINCTNAKKSKLLTLDSWVTNANTVTNFTKQPFEKIFFKKPSSKEVKQATKATHLFYIKAPQLLPNQTLCIIGSNKKTGSWNTTNPTLLKLFNGVYSVALILPKTEDKLVYKYGVYDTKAKNFIQFEQGENRILLFEREKNELFIINDGIIDLPIQNWKGAGVAIPVFGLRSKSSFGVGEFSDIKNLASWCSKVGLKLIQLLPINDTIVTKTNADSYPYAANSSFALHPLYINLHEIGILPKESKSETSYPRMQRKLNKLEAMDYEATIKFKLQYLKELYVANNGIFLTEETFLQFFENNKHWLVSYSVYAYLRDKNKTTDFSKWGTYSTIDAKKLEKISAATSKQFKDIAFWYFVQYHLHIQLKDAVAFAYQLGIILKGDIPIGIGRTSCDAWQHPHLFNMDKQAGAPPDDFAVKGQNWGFPTYNWQAMQLDGFKWWKERFAKMSDYFDAFRIDHILGFFRIWSIPLHAVEGIMGHFIPAIPIHKDEFVQRGIYLDIEKFTKPYFTTYFLQNIFENKFTEVTNVFFDFSNDYFTLKPEFTTQKNIETYFINNKTFNEVIKIKLYDCVSNVILFEEKESSGSQFHFNIAMHKTHAYSLLNQHQKDLLYKLYVNYFYERQDAFWKIEANKKLPSLHNTTNMLICGEDLGMVPSCVPGVMSDLSMLSLEVQRMPKATNTSFVHLPTVPYLSVATPSTHDMSTIRGWWEEDKSITQKFYNNSLGHYGEAPQFCEAWVALDIIKQHLQAPSMWSIFQLQDLLAIHTTLRRDNPNDERINVPANPNHYWCYRMHLKLEDLLKEKEYNTQLKELILSSGR